MSTLQVSNISDGTKSVPATVVTEGAPVMTYRYNQIANVLNSSYNVSSVLDSGPGQHAVNFNNTMNSHVYQVSGSCSVFGTTSWCMVWAYASATTGINANTTRGDGSLNDLVDNEGSAALVSGDLA